MTLSDLKRRGMIGQNFLADLHKYSLTQNDQIWHSNTRVGETYFFWVSHVHIFRDRGPSVP